MHYVQPELPYQEAALEPAISAKTVHFHYGVHEKTYIENLNKLIVGTQFENEDLEDIIREADGPLYNNAAQAWNHIFYFFSLNPDGGGEPDGELRKAIDRDFGSFEEFKTKFVDAGAKLFGSGWVWLSKDSDGKLFILTFDVWEHAYYLDYQNRRADALNALWQVVDWDIVCTRY